MSAVNLPDDLVRRLADEAERLGVGVDELAARVIDEHMPARRRLRFIGVGASDQSDATVAYKDRRREAFGRLRSDEV